MDVEVYGKMLSHLAQRRRPPVPLRPVAAADASSTTRPTSTLKANSPTTCTGVYLRNTENPLHPAIAGTTRSTATR